MAMMALVGRRCGAALAPVRPSRRPLSLLSAIFGIGEFEGARERSLRGSTGKQQAFSLALLDVRSLRLALVFFWGFGG